MHFFWLLAIHPSEAKWIVRHDDETLPFEHALQAVDPDHFDLYREPVELE